MITLRKTAGALLLGCGAALVLAGDDPAVLRLPLALQGALTLGIAICFAGGVALYVIQPGGPPKSSDLAHPKEPLP